MDLSVYCSECGCKLSANQKFCTECGTKLATPTPNIIEEPESISSTELPEIDKDTTVALPAENAFETLLKDDKKVIGISVLIVFLVLSAVTFFNRNTKMPASEQGMSEQVNSNDNSGGGEFPANKEEFINRWNATAGRRDQIPLEFSSKDSWMFADGTLFLSYRNRNGADEYAIVVVNGNVSDFIEPFSRVIKITSPTLEYSDATVIATRALNFNSSGQGSTITEGEVSYKCLPWAGGQCIARRGKFE